MCFTSRGNHTPMIAKKPLSFRIQYYALIRKCKDSINLIYIYKLKRWEIFLIFLSMAHKRISLLSIILVVLTSPFTDQSKEILIDEERPIIKMDSHEEYPHESIEEAFEHAPCHMEYQVSKLFFFLCTVMYNLQTKFQFINTKNFSRVKMYYCMFYVRNDQMPTKSLLSHYSF